MANKKQTATKVTEKELKNIQEKVDQINRLQMQIGAMELQKTVAIKRVEETQKLLGILQDGLKSKYGDMTVNISEGTLTPIQNEQG